MRRNLPVTRTSNSSSLIAFLRGSVYQEERMRRLEALKARDAAEESSPVAAEAPESRTTYGRTGQRG